jgi:hypothetical protein
MYILQVKYYPEREGENEFIRGNFSLCKRGVGSSGS